MLFEKLGRLRQHRFWLSLALILLTWPACELSQEIGHYTSRELEAGRLHQAQELWNKRPFDQYQASVGRHGGGWITWEELQANQDPLECLGAMEFLRSYSGHVILDTCQPQLDVNGVFKGIEASIYHDQCGPNGCHCDGTLHIRVDYDAQYGYPTRIEREFRHDWTNIRWLPIEIATLFRGCFLRANDIPEITLLITPQ